MGSIRAVVDPLDVPEARDLRLRDARPGEFDGVAALLGEVYGAFREQFPPQAWERYLGEIVAVRSRVGESELIIAERAGRLVGTIGFYPDASRSALERWPAGWGSIRTLAVSAGERCGGVGEALARECVRRASDRRLRAIGLHTAPYLQAATRLYERLGFRRAAGLDIESGEMFTGRSLPAEESWLAQAYVLELEEE